MGLVQTKIARAQFGFQSDPDCVYICVFGRVSEDGYTHVAVVKVCGFVHMCSCAFLSWSKDIVTCLNVCVCVCVWRGGDHL